MYQMITAFTTGQGKGSENVRNFPQFYIVEHTHVRTHTHTHTYFPAIHIREHIHTRARTHTHAVCVCLLACQRVCMFARMCVSHTCVMSTHTQT